MITPTSPTVSTIAAICHHVSRVTGVDPYLIFSANRGHPRVATARQVAMTLVRERTGLTLCQIAKVFHRTHPTVLHACRATRRQGRARQMYLCCAQVADQ